MAAKYFTESKNLFDCRIAKISFMQPWGSIVLVICQIAKDALLKQKVEMVTAILIIWPFTR